MKKFILSLLAIFTLAAGCNHSVAEPSPAAPATATVTPTSRASPTLTFTIMQPISNARARVTKKFFGTYVTPTDSPVQPERFTGYHTGIDFETYPNEQNTNVPIYAVCTGPLLLKEWASGYGGVAVQGCTIAGQAVTVIYGHLRLSSITPAKGAQVSAGTQIAVLGTGYTTETDGERMNLHFGIHKGTSINILGYVQSKSDLSGWLDPLPFLPPASS